MDEDFLEVLKSTIESTLAPERLVVKKISGIEVTGKQFAEYFQQFLNLFQSNTLPEAQSIYDATIEKQVTMVIEDCLKKYKELVYSNIYFVENVKSIPQFHDNCKNQALFMFENAKKMGNNKKWKAEFLSVLENRIEEFYQEWSNTSEENFQKIQDELEKTFRLMEEKEREFQQQMQVVQEVAARASEIEKKKSEMNQEMFDELKITYDQRFRSEEKRMQQLQNERDRDEEYRRKFQSMQDTQSAKTSSVSVSSDIDLGWFGKIKLNVSKFFSQNSGKKTPHQNDHRYMNQYYGNATNSNLYLEDSKTRRYQNEQYEY
jgi:hypothetical protein